METEDVKELIREIKDFPKPGVLFKDLSQIYKSPAARIRLAGNHNLLLKKLTLDKGYNLESSNLFILGIEARGFLMGMTLSNTYQLPFVMARKAGKLPPPVHKESYALEYGQETLEVNPALLNPGDNVIIHDDVLATGGTAEAAYKLVQRCGATPVAFSFTMQIPSLSGMHNLERFKIPIYIALEDYMWEYKYDDNA